MNIPFTKEELQRFAENGTLEGHLLSQGLLPLKVLEFVLAEDNLREEELIAENEELLKKINSMLEEYDW